METSEALRRPGGRSFYFPGVADSDWYDWRWQFRNRITTIEEIAEKLPFPSEEWAPRREVMRDFRAGITPYYLSLIDPNDPNDPLFRQVVPTVEEHLFRCRRRGPARRRGVFSGPGHHAPVSRSLLDGDLEQLRDLLPLLHAQTHHVRGCDS